MEARALFVKALQTESQGDAMSAISYYKKAFQLDPSLQSYIGDSITVGDIEYDMDGNVIDELGLVAVLGGAQKETDYSQYRTKWPITVVGVGGPSTSGKSTLVRYLKQLKDFEVITVHCDSFFKCVTSVEGETENWEIPEALEEDLILREIAHKLEDAKGQTDKPVLVLIEGFLIYSFPSITAQLDLSIYVTIDKETCCQRRKANPKYFNEVLWTSYLLHNKPLLDMLDKLFIIDGTRPKKEVVETIANYLRGQDVLSETELFKQNLH